MKKLISLMLVLATLLSFNIVSNFNVRAENYCKASVVIEKSTNRVLFERNKDEKLAMASTTKIMTALVTLENCENLDENAVT